jgi:hypothetical protein
VENELREIRKWRRRQPPWKQTFTGKMFNILNPKVESVNILDIAHGLSLICRYTGQCREFYSVAEHSILVADLCKNESPELQMRALLHDAAEAYLGDFPGPAKKFFPKLKAIEALIEDTILKAFDLPLHKFLDNNAIEIADVKVMLAEKVQIMTKPDIKWVVPKLEVPAVVLQCLSPVGAKWEFLAAYRKLEEKRENGKTKD